MRRRDLDTQVSEAIELGHRNQEILRLAAGWCRNLKLDRRHTGVGVVEEQTGLPIGGGMFRCDYAAGPLTSGMQLEHIALDFYSRHCRGCKFRDPAGVFPNLGTWAEPRLREREARDALQAEAEAAAESARSSRRDQRRLIASSLGPVAREVIDLINALDSGGAASDDQGDLLALASLHPDAFDDALIGMLILDLEAHGFGGILECLIELNRLTGRPATARLVELATRCLTRSVSTAPAATFVARAGSDMDVDSADIRRIAIALAGRGARDEPFERGPDPEPSLLLRVYRVNPSQLRASLGEELRHGDGWRRATAARAAAVLIDSHADAGPPLLPAILDGLGIDDNSRYHGDAFPLAQLAKSASMVLMTAPAAVDAVVETRWRSASPEVRQALLRVYDRAVRDRLRDEVGLPEVTADSIVRRAIAALGDPDLDVVRAAADMLELVGRYHPTSVPVALEPLLGSIALMVSRLDGVQNAGPAATALAQLERSGQLATLAAATRDTTDGVAEIAARRPAEFWALLAGLWEASADGSFREFAVRLIEKVAERQDALSLALPFLYSAALAGPSLQRAQALRTIATLVPDRAVVPELLRDVILGALSDQFLRVVHAAVSAVGVIELDAPHRVPVIQHLLVIAGVYASEREQDDLVRDCVWGALRLASGIGLEDQVADAVLSTVHSMPAHSAAELLSRTGRLRNRASWRHEASHALRFDGDPAYADLGERERDDLLEAIAISGPTDDPDLISAMRDRAHERLEAFEDRHWAWRIAETLACLGAYDAASDVAGEVVKSIPDTIEERHQRYLAQQVELAMELELRIAAGDARAIDRILMRWAELEAASIEDLNRQNDAELDFFLA